MRQGDEISVGILHRSVVPGDAIGNDIVGQYRTLKLINVTPTIVCEYPHQQILECHRVSCDVNPESVRKNFDVLIYHHSVDWPAGEEIVKVFAGPVIAKYHCVTPESYFSAYSANCEEACRNGRVQTARLAKCGRVDLWMSDSQHNSDEIGTLGIGEQRRVVVPPFNRTAKLVKTKTAVRWSSDGEIRLLFVGRRSPHKGHRHLICALASYVALFSKNIKLRMVGAVDDFLTKYSNEMLDLAVNLGVDGNVEWITHISDKELEAIFADSHIYMNASEHEGFCVPIIEAQAIGIPIITTKDGASGETAGPNQIVLPQIKGDDDYDLIAGIIREIAADDELRAYLVREGFRNVYERFSDQSIENSFVAALVPFLK